MARDLDLDLGSGHTAYRRASLIDLYLYTKFHSNWRNFLWTDGRTYGRTYGRTSPPSLILLGRLLEVDLIKSFNRSRTIAPNTQKFLTHAVQALRTTKCRWFTFTKTISRRTLKLLIPDDFRDNCLLICRKDRDATTSLTRDIAVQSFRTVTQADDFTHRWLLADWTQSLRGTCIAYAYTGGEGRGCTNLGSDFKRPLL